MQSISKSPFSRLLPLVVAATLAPSPLLSQQPDPFEPIVWITGTAATPGTATISGSEGGVKKTGIAGWNADAVSTQYILADGEVEFTSPAGDYVGLGLGTTDANQDFSDLDFSILISNTNLARVLEGGTARFTLPTRTSSTVYKIRRTGTTVQYLVDDVVAYTSTVSSTGTLYVDTCFYYTNDEINMAKINDGDLDDDDMPDLWELSWLPAGSDWEDVENFLPGDHADGDTLTNLVEYQNRTSPLDGDTDGDGMPDDWEVTAGLLPLDQTDAMADKDGDRVPNLWEYARGTSANDVNQFPPFDVIVDSRLSADNPSGSPPRFRTLQGAYEALSSSSTYRSLVQVVSGKYPARLDASATPKKVAWLATGGPDRSMGVEGAMLTGQNITEEQPVQGLKFSDECYMEGFIFDGAGANLVAPAVSLVPHVTVAASLPEMRMVNCIVRNWRSEYAEEPLGPGAVLNDGGDLWLVHCTLWSSCSKETEFGIHLSIVENRTGSLRLVNSIVWDGDHAPSYAVAGSSGMTALNSVIQGGLLGGVNTNPLLTPHGYLKTTSTACLNKTSNAWTKWDVNGEARTSTTTGVDLGADDFNDADADAMPTWWELFWFGTVATAASADANTPPNSITNLNEYLGSTIPTYDQDGDTLPDLWELQYFWNILAQNSTGNPDNDARNNAAEYTAGKNPTVVDTDYTGDSDGDGLPDNWEYSNFGNLASQTGTGDPDQDGCTNLQEWQNSTNPNSINVGWDGDTDTLPDWWELLYFQNKSQVAGGNPDADELTNYQEYLLYDPDPDIGRDPTKIDLDSTTDADSDGLRDGWELRYFGMLSYAAVDDPDRDGCPNSTEQTQGSDPSHRGGTGELDHNWDGDSDGIPDWWELDYFATVAECFPGDNPDYDGRTNQEEWERRRDNPNSPELWVNPQQIDHDYDSDTDGLPDYWEQQNFQWHYGSGYLFFTGPDQNPDGDARTNLQEFTSGTNPWVIDADWDGDGDGLPYGFETTYSLNPNLNDADGDPDADGSNNFAEYQRGTNPQVLDADFDADGLNDQDEIAYWGSYTAQDEDGDPDGDTLTNHQEMNIYGSNPTQADTAGLGFGDVFMVRMGYSFDGDVDNDGVSDSDEAEQGTNPFIADSDGDGVSDFSDSAPLDPATSSPTSVSGPPQVVLILPIGIQLQP